MSQKRFSATLPRPAKVSSRLPRGTATKTEIIPKRGPCASDGKPVCDEAVRLRAYAKWEAAGRPEGDGVVFWLEAEQELSRGPQAARA